ncbi:MAG: T9SS type A sorting domain-containing protein [Flavobacteriales bacterium]|nr:T9SS type A sorting domain-containing protein [Flavobacteriales bacterium]
MIISKKINLGVTLLIASLIVSPLFFTVKSKKSYFEPETHPGYGEQFYQIKQNENGEIPRGLWKQWDAQTPKFHSKIDFFKEVKELGPSNIGGRTRALIVDAANANHFIAGGVSGGIWNSYDAGKTWIPVDDAASTLSVTGITQNPFNPNEIYYSTGERSTGVYINYDGNGIFKSEDGGKSFFQIEGSDITAFDKTWDIAYSQTDSNTFYVASITGGLFRSTDKGKTFKQIFNTASEACDVDPMPNGRVYIAGGKKGIYYFDEADDITVQKFNIPVSSFNRCLVAASESDSNIIYAAFANTAGDGIIGIYKSIDYGENWAATTMPVSSISYDFTWYCFTLGVHPTNPDFVICAAQDPGYSSNGGQSWGRMKNGHADYHNVTFIPNSNDFLMLCDGGIYKLNTATVTSKVIDLNYSYNVTQFYSGFYSPTGDEVVAGAQDNWTTMNNNGGSSFSQILSGDGAFNAIDNTGEILYASSQNGNLRRSSNGTWFNIYNSLAATVGTQDFWFINPFEINPTDGMQVYFPTKKYLARSINGGNNWQLLTNQIAGSVFSVGMTPEDNPTLYFGGYSSILYRINNAKTATTGSEFRMYTLSPANAKGGFIGNIEIDPDTNSTIYLAMSNISTLPRIWKVRNANTSNPEWVDISGNLPQSLPVNWIEVDPANTENIMIATDYGLYVTGDGGKFWYKEESIPNVYISMIRLRESDRRLYIFTYGRGAWIAQLKDEVVKVDQIVNKNPVVYPNPSKDVISISNIDVQKVQIFNLKGVKVSENKAANSIDVSSLTEGIYFIRIMDRNGKETTTKFVKN